MVPNVIRFTLIWTEFIYASVLHVDSSTCLRMKILSSSCCATFIMAFNLIILKILTSIKILGLSHLIKFDSKTLSGIFPTIEDIISNSSMKSITNSFYLVCRNYCIVDLFFVKPYFSIIAFLKSSQFKKGSRLFYHLNHLSALLSKFNIDNCNFSWSEYGYREKYMSER